MPEANRETLTATKVAPSLVAQQISATKNDAGQCQPTTFKSIEADPEGVSWKKLLLTITKFQKLPSPKS